MKLAKYVKVTDPETGMLVKFGPESGDLPEWAAKQITRDDLWDWSGTLEPDQSPLDHVPPHLKDEEEVDYSVFTVAELRAELSNRGLVNEGNKADLIIRLQRNDAEKGK